MNKNENITSEFKGVKNDNSLDLDENKNILQPKRMPMYIYISGAGLLITILIFACLVFFRNTLNLILADRAYYIILFPLAFSSAAFLFGVMNSHAKFIHGGLRLGGPVVVAALVVYGGFMLHGETEFYYTIRIKTDPSIVLSPVYPKPVNDTLIIQLDDEPKEGNPSKGAFDFKKINGQYKNQKIPITYKAKYWKSSSDTILLANSSTTLLIIPDGSLSKIDGSVLDANGIPVPNAKVFCLGEFTNSKEDGSYELQIPTNKQAISYTAAASLDTYSGSTLIAAATHVPANIYLYGYYPHKQK